MPDYVLPAFLGLLAGVAITVILGTLSRKQGGIQSWALFDLTPGQQIHVAEEIPHKSIFAWVNGVIIHVVLDEQEWSRLQRIKPKDAKTYFVFRNQLDGTDQ